VEEPLSPQKETHKVVVGFLFSKKAKLVCAFYRKQKRQNSCKEFGFLCLFWISFWEARSDSLFLNKTFVNS
jgi:hypothetical protein